MRRALWVAAIMLAIMVVPAAAEFKPTVTPLGQIFAQYQYNMSGYEDYDVRYDTNDHNKFDVTRTYLGLAAQLSEHWSAKIVLDSKREMKYDMISVPTGVADDPNTPADESVVQVMGTTGTPTGQYMMYMRFGFFTYQPYDAFGVSFGQITTPWFDHYGTVWAHLFITGEPWSRYAHTRDNHADLGVKIHGNFPKGYGMYQVMFANGEGGFAPEANAGKTLQASLILRPLQAVDALKGFQLWGLYHYDKVQPDFPEELRTAFKGDVSYKYAFNEDMGFQVAGDFNQTVTSIDIEGVDDVTQQSYGAWVDFWFAKKYGVVLRYDSNDPNTENDEATGMGYQDETTYTLAGFYYKPIPAVKLALDWQNIGYTAEIVDDQGEDVVKQPDQFISIHTDVKF